MLLSVKVADIRECGVSDGRPSDKAVSVVGEGAVWFQHAGVDSDVGSEHGINVSCSAVYLLGKPI